MTWIDFVLVFAAYILIVGVCQVAKRFPIDSEELRQQRRRNGVGNSLLDQ